MSNRFDNGSISAYTPQSFQELSFVPMMKRAQHDEMSKNLAELNAIATDPLDVHRERALELKQNLEAKLGNLSQELASKGIDNLGKEAFYKLQKERNDLIAPTGKIGQINAAKIDYNKQKEEFIKNAEQQKIGRDRALQLWNEKTKTYSGYDNNENILNVTPQGVAAHQDYEDDLMKYHSILGKTTSSAKSSGYSIVDSGQGDGSKIMIDRVGNIVHSDNISQLNDAIKGFSSKWINPNGEGAKYAKDADLNITPDKVFNDFKAMTEKSDIDNRGLQTQYIPGAKPYKEESSSTGSSVGTPIDIKEIGIDLKEYDELDRIGSIRQNLNAPKPPSRNLNTMTPDKIKEYYDNNKKENSIFKYDDISNPYLKKKYVAIYNRLRENGTIPKNISADSPKAAALVKAKIMQDGPITLASNVITTDMELNNLGFPGTKIGKDSKERTSSVVKDLQAGTRRFIDPEDGKSKTWNEMVEAGYDPKTTSYYGYMSPHSWSDTKFGAKDKNVSQHQITIVKDDKIYTTEISRTRNDGSVNDIKASNDLKKTYQAVTIEPNEFVNFKGDNPKLKGVKVAYVTKDQNGQILQEPVFVVRKGNQQQIMSEADYMATVYKLYE